jgi:hypothetical protein
MPNKTKRYKRGESSTGRAHVRNVRKGDSVKALLKHGGGVALARVSQQAAQQMEWRKWLESQLPSEAAAHVSGVVERGDTLVVFTESAAWSARVRYAVAEIEPLIKKKRQEIRQVVVRVMPRS